MTEGVLSALLKAGGVGGSLAFLWLGYRLLAKEQQREPARNKMLLTIGAFVVASLAFFIVGVLADVVAKHSDRMVDHIMGRYVRSDVVTLGLSDWNRGREKPELSFGLRETNLRPDRYIAEADRGNYRIVVAVRAHKGLPTNAGTYPVAYGWHSFGPMNATPLQLTAKEEEELGAGRIALAVFAVPKSEATIGEVPRPFDPQKYPGIRELFVAYHEPRN